MAAVRLTEINRAFITFAPPWSNRLIKLGRLAYPPGVMPPQLERYATDVAFRNRALESAQRRVRAASTAAGGGTATQRGRGR